MLLALATAVVAVVLGAIGALVAHRRLWALAPVRAFAVIAVASSVALHLLPESVAGAGWGVLAVCAAGFVAPPLIGRAAAVAAAGARHRRLAIELGYAGVLLHQIGDGLGLGASSHAGHVDWAFLIGVVAHSVPLVAMITLTFAELGGPRATWWRVLGLLLATSLGIVLTGSDVVIPPGAAPWINAGVAGLLFHILLHDADDREVPAATRPLEALGVLIGAALPLLADQDHVAIGLGAALPDALVSAAGLVGPLVLVALAAATLAPAALRLRSQTALVGPGVPLATVVLAYALAAARGDDGQVWSLTAHGVPAAMGLAAATVVGAAILWRVARIGFIAWLGTAHDHGDDHGDDAAPGDRGGDHHHDHHHDH
jgi:hypothetical protein